MNTNNHNDHEDLEGLPPHLNKSGSKTPFKANDDYFESFASKMQERVDAFDELHVGAPLLSNIPKYNPFEAPAGYFDALPQLVQERCISHNANSSLLDKLILLLKPKFAIPALMLIAIAFAGSFYLNTTSPEVVNPEIAEETTVEDQLQNIDEATILDALTAEVTETSSDNEDDHIVDYLIDNNIDETSLNNEL